MSNKNKLGRLVQETAGFSYEFIRHPKKMGSVIPSSRMLARAMRRTAQDYGAPNSIVIEAGAGTGAITRELVAHFPAERLLINELNPRLARRLRDRFPHNTVRRGGEQESPLNLPPESDISGERVTYAWLNFPPARIWIYRCRK